MRVRPSTEKWIDEILQRPDSFKYAIPSLRVAFNYSGVSGQANEVQTVEGLHTQRPGLKRLSNTGETIDPFRLRYAFQHVDSEKSMAEFLAVCGPFRDYTLPQNISSEEFRDWQVFVQKLMSGHRVRNPPRWPNEEVESMDRIQDQPHLEIKHALRSGGLYVEIFCRTALEIIGASIFLDRIGQVSFTKCALVECPGTVSTKRDYCSDQCRAAAKKQRQRRRAEGGRNVKAGK